MSLRRRLRRQREARDRDKRLRLFAVGVAHTLDRYPNLDRGDVMLVVERGDERAGEIVVARVPAPDVPAMVASLPPRVRAELERTGWHTLPGPRVVAVCEAGMKAGAVVDPNYFGQGACA